MSAETLIQAALRTTAAGVPEGYDALLLGQMVHHAFADTKSALLFVVPDDARLAATADAVSFFAPDVDIVRFPAWDCLPYDRVGPHKDLVARRIQHPAVVAHRVGLSAGLPQQAAALRRAF